MQVLAFLDHFGIADDDPRVNPYGGAIAVGHPLASSGVRLMTQPRPAVRGAPRGPLRAHHDVHRARHGRHRDLGEPGLHHRARGHRRMSAPAPTTEVVTAAKVRLLDLPFDAGRAALITLDNGLDHTRPNTFGPGGLARAGRRAGRDRARRLRRDRRPSAVTGKPFVFAVGADLTGVPSITDRDAGPRARRGSATRVLRPVRASCAVPTFAFVNGAAMGGGLELALHCHVPHPVQRRGRRSPSPRCFLGLVPAWGGTHLLPNLIGADARGRGHHREPVEPEPDAQGAARRTTLGIADALLEPADFLERVAALGGEGGARRDQRRAARRSTAVPAGTAAVGPRPGRRRRALPRRGARRRTAPWTCSPAGPHGAPGDDGVRRRGRRARRPA